MLTGDATQSSTAVASILCVFLGHTHILCCSGALAALDLS
jgi:hypothetical protein